MAIVCNTKPIMGEIEFKLEKRPKPILFFKIHLNQEKQSLSCLSDIKLKLEHSQIIQHMSGVGTVYEFDLGAADDKEAPIDLNVIVDKLFSC
jgi:hypothetical protein